MRDAAGLPRYFISQVQDITARKQLQEALREQAIRDPLTGLYSRRYLDDILPPELQRCAMSGEPLTIAMLDLDHFKRFNDGYGHEAGDSVLRAVGQALRKAMRGSDIACRYGGEELTVVLPGATLGRARRRLAEVQGVLTSLHLHHRGQALPAVTASIGLAAAQPGETASALLGRADAALYRAKAQGRDCIVAADRPRSTLGQSPASMRVSAQAAN